MLNLNFKNSGRGYLEISFSWFFAVLVGIMILSLAIFAVTKIIKVGQTAQDVKVGKEIGILLNPLETSFEVGKTTSLSLPVETRIFNNCSDKSIRVCFGGGNCDVFVNYNLNYVTKGSQKFYFEGDALMYAAVFSDKDVYECQLKRLMQRGEQLSLLYKNKATFVVWTGCKSNLDLLCLSNLQKSFVSSLGLASISRLADEIKEKNDVAECKLW